MATEGWKPVDPAWGYTIALGKISLAEARERVTAVLKDEGFGILTEIDVQATMKKKLDKDVAPYVILGACNPVIAARALAADPGIGLLLPCNVCLWEDSRGTVVSFAKPESMFALITNPSVAPIAGEAGTKIRNAAEKLAGRPLDVARAVR